MSPTAPAQDAAAWRRFGALECPHEPLYVALCETIAESPELLHLMQAAPPEQRRPNLLLAALHERVLAGAGHGLSAYYPTVGGLREPDAALPAALHEMAGLEREALLAHLRHGATQTNEVARCAALWPALADVARWTGQTDLALLDFGCSAGLNLGVDGYHYRFHRADGSVFERGAAADGRRVEIDADWWGPEPASRPWRLLARHGVDPAPVDLHDPARLRWLLACLWPHDERRAERLQRAATQALTANWPLQQADDCVAAIEPWLSTLPPGVQPLLFNSWVLTYLNAQALQALRATVDRLALSHGLAWLSAELPHLSARDQPAPPGPDLPPGQAHASATLWTLRWPDGGVIRERALAWSHPHGAWVYRLA